MDIICYINFALQFCVWLLGYIYITKWMDGWMDGPRNEIKQRRHSSELLL